MHGTVRESAVCIRLPMFPEACSVSLLPAQPLCIIYTSISPQKYLHGFNENNFLSFHLSRLLCFPLPSCCKDLRLHCLQCLCSLCTFFNYYIRNHCTLPQYCQCQTVTLEFHHQQRGYVFNVLHFI